LLDLLEDPQPQRQPGVNAGGLLPYHAGAQHQAMRDDFGLFRVLFEDRQEKPRQSHRNTTRIAGKSSTESGLTRKTQDRDLGKAAK
jgi:hypothetical protein